MTEIEKRLQDKNFIIMLPTRDRTHLIRSGIGFWRHYTKKFSEYPRTMVPRLIVRESEVEDYNKVCIDRYGEPDIYVVHDHYNLAEKRQRCIELAHHSNKEFLFLIDDDVSFYVRTESLSSKYTSRLEKILAEEIYPKILYESIMLCGERFPIVGLPSKQGSNAIRYMFPKNTPIIRIMCFHVPTLMKEEINLDHGWRQPFMSDRYLELALLEKGYCSLSNSRYAVGDFGTGYKGGCATTRTAGGQSNVARALVKRFPERVSLKVKNNGMWAEERLDCSIDWKGFLPEGEEKFLPSEEGLQLIQREGYIAHEGI